MRRTVPAIVIALAVWTSAFSGEAAGDVRRPGSGQRPFIVGIGAPQSIGPAALAREARAISELGEYLSTYGYPDYAEIQEIRPEWPWAPYEVRMYYLHRNLETTFGHVIFSPAMPDLGVLKFQGGIEPAKRREIETAMRARQAPPHIVAAKIEAPAALEKPPPLGLSDGLLARVEAAAERAAQAAERAVEHSEAAARAADRAVEVVDRMEPGGR